MVKRIYALLFAFGILSLQAQEATWKGYKITYIGKTAISKKMDANQNTKLRIENISNTAAAPIYFDHYIEGFTASVFDGHGGDLVVYLLLSSLNTHQRI